MIKQALFETCLRLGDNALVLGQRLCEWSSKAPTLELDIALSNQALDLIGQAHLLLDYAGTVEGKGRDADRLAYFRVDGEFRNVQLVELPIGDFAHTILRQFLYGTHAELLYERLAGSADETLAGIAAKAVKEMAYHARHGGEWVVRLGQGTDESYSRMVTALDALWPYAHELFQTDETDEEMIAAGVLPDAAGLKPVWQERVAEGLDLAGLVVPDGDWRPQGGRQGVHTQHLSYMLAEMQVLQRTYPGLKW